MSTSQPKSKSMDIDSFTDLDKGKSTGADLDTPLLTKEQHSSIMDRLNSLTERLDASEKKPLSAAAEEIYEMCKHHGINIDEDGLRPVSVKERKWAVIKFGPKKARDLINNALDEHTTTLKRVLSSSAGNGINMPAALKQITMSMLLPLFFLFFIF